MAPSRRRRPNAGSRRGLLARLGSLYAAYLVSQTGNWVFRAAALYDIYDAQRTQLVQLRNEGAISDEVRRKIERDLDLEESRLEN